MYNVIIFSKDSTKGTNCKYICKEKEKNKQQKKKNIK